MIPVRVKNLLPACKNISMTQIANGCYRLHPTEWNIGEAAGTLTAYAIKQQVEPSAVRESAEHLRAYQQQLIALGVQLHWTPEEMEA